MTKDPKAPIAPASEGAKTPRYRPPITSIKSAITPQTPVNAFIFSFQEKVSPGGPNLGFRVHITRINATNIVDNIRPGKIPAIKRDPIGGQTGPGLRVATVVRGC